jgi:hypothetical protein
MNMDDVRRDAHEAKMKAAIGANAFADFQLEKKSRHKSPESELIEKFMIEVNKERPAGSFYIKKGKKVKLNPMTFMGIRSSKNILGIANDAFELEHFMKECIDYRKRNGTFNKRFFGAKDFSTDKKP